MNPDCKPSEEQCHCRKHISICIVISKDTENEPGRKENTVPFPRPVLIEPDKCEQNDHDGELAHRFAVHVRMHEELLRPEHHCKRKNPCGPAVIENAPRKLPDPDGHEDTRGNIHKPRRINKDIIRQPTKILCPHDCAHDHVRETGEKCIRSAVTGDLHLRLIASRQFAELRDIHRNDEPRYFIRRIRKQRLRKNDRLRNCQRNCNKKKTSQIQKKDHPFGFAVFRALLSSLTGDIYAFMRFHIPSSGLINPYPVCMSCRCRHTDCRV